METFVLVLVMRYGTSMTTVPGYASLIACQNAATEYNRAVTDHEHSQYGWAICINGPKKNF